MKSNPCDSKRPWHGLLPALLLLAPLIGCVSGGGTGDAGGAAPKDDPSGAWTTVAFGSCAHQDRPQPIWDRVLGADPDVFLFIGDNVYGDVASQNNPEMPELRAAYDKLAAVEGFARFRQQVPILPIWDDHDYGQNDGGGDFALRFHAEAIFREFWQIPDDDPRARRAGLYHAVTHGPPGKRVQVILLDTRSFRSELTPSQEPGPGRERYQPEPDPARTMLGRNQWEWLREQLMEPAEVRLLVSSVQVIAEGHGWERWGNLPTERQRLFELIDQTRAAGVVLLSGDRHRGGMYRLEQGVPYPLYEVTSSALNLPASEPSQEPGPHRLGPLHDGENFGVVQIYWERGELALELRGLNGEVVQREVTPMASLQRALPRPASPPAEE